MNDNELIHFGVPGMKWGKRKQKEYSKAPEGASIKKQIRVLNAKQNLKNSTYKTRKADRAEYKAAKKDLKKGIKEYRDFSKAMYKKVGDPRKLRIEKNSKGKMVSVNKKGESFKSFELEGAASHIALKKYRKQKVKNIVLSARNIALAGSILASSGGIGIKSINIIASRH